MASKKQQAIRGLNKTKKCKPTPDELNILCRKSANTFNRFEEEYEKSIKGNVAKKTLDFEKELINFFSEPYAPKSITPRSDYYTYINYKWIERQKKLTQKEKKYYVQNDNFRMKQEEVYYELLKLIKNYIDDNSTTKLAKEVQAVQYSCLHDNESVLKKHMKDYINELDDYIARDDLIGFLAKLNKNEIVSWGCPVNFSIQQDLKDAGTNRCYISFPQLTFYDYELYIDDPLKEPKEKEYRKEFLKNFSLYVNRLFNFCLGEGHGIKSSDIVEIELEIMTQIGCDELKNEDPDFYNIVKKDEALTKYGFDWNQFCKELGYTKAPDFFICSSINYLKCIMNTLKNNWKTEKWRNYFLYIVFRQMIRFNNRTRREIYFEFFGKFVNNQPVAFPNEVNAIFPLSLCFNTFLTNQYVENNKKQEIIDYVHNMAADLKTVFIRILKRNQWLSPQTKQKALEKLYHLKLIVGSPKILREDPMLNYEKGDIWANMLKITKWRSDKEILLEGKPLSDIPIIDWQEFKLVGTQAYVVNAYYTPTLNTIYVPLGYLQKPFVDLDERGIEYNLANIGYTLGHEMGHSIDDSGSKYDYKGNLKNWWTPHDRQIFQKKVNDVIAQYEHFAALDGIKMDATESAGEDLADIAGLAICQEYLRDFQDKNEDIAAIRQLSYEAFYTYIAVTNRQHIFEKAIKAQLKVNPHPLNKYRTNCPLTRLKLFRSIFKIVKGDKMYWHNTDTIW
jgi:putative endopeptidase